MGYEAHYAFGRTPETPLRTDSHTAFEQFAGIGPAREQSVAPEGPFPSTEKEVFSGRENDGRSAFERFAGIGPT